MFDIRTLLILIPALPLLSAILIGMLGPKVLRSKSHRVLIVALIGSFLCSLGVVAHVNSATSEMPGVGYEHVETLWTWAAIPEAYELDGTWLPFHIDVSLRADGLTAMMLPMVTFIATLVVIYAAGYMQGDRGYWRFFAYVSLFVFSMTMLVLVSNFLLLFVFWEAVGVCSYLLVGFWYQKEEAAAAGMKAFLVNRVGDFGFALAIFLIWISYGTLDFHDAKGIAGVFGQQRLSGELVFVGGGMATAICVLLMLGACGKSAQFPLHVWLPDAMEGPTPVSALIHAATMVTAGVYMVARCTPLFTASADAQLTVACIGGFTALMAGLIAITQFDLKRVLAYSTISQLGYMFLALGTGTVAGITAGMFHLFTHAFFKALLFLGAGSVMHSMGNVIDMRQFGGLRQLMPWTHRTFLVGCLALAGVFPFAGFWSKDQIIASVHGQYQHHAESTHTDALHQHEPHAASSDRTTTQFAASSQEGMDHVADSTMSRRERIFQWLYWMAVFSAFLTALYTFRAYFMTFFGEFHVPSEAGHHAHESPPMMWVPLAVLAVFAFGVGFISEMGHSLARFITTAPSLAYLVGDEGFHGEPFHMDIAIVSTCVALSGIGVAAYFFLGRQNEAEVLGRVVAPLRNLSYHKFYFDELYSAVIVWPVRFLATVSYAVDRVIIDGLVNVIGRWPLRLGSITRRLQNGLVPRYGLLMAAGAVVIVGLGGWLWFGG